MNIVFEGPDNSGKSTLARYVANHVKKNIILSEGPDKYPGEINERILRYEQLRGVIFDRHPCVSHPIYSSFRTITPIKPELLLRFYDSKPVFIYCRARGLEGHVIKDHIDTADHLESITTNADGIARMYDEWATHHALIWYRVGDSMERILDLVQGYLKESTR